MVLGPLADYEPQVPALPASVDENLGIEQNRFRRAAGQIDFQNFLRKQIVSFLAYAAVALS
jgi:hypothetical protein